MELGSGIRQVDDQNNYNEGRMRAMMVETQSRAELHFRKSGRWLLMLLVLLFPVGIIASKLDRILGSDLIFAAIEIVFMAAFLFVCVWRYVSYCLWTGKYPFSLRRRSKL